MKSEIVHLRARADSKQAVLDHLVGHPYFEQTDLAGSRVLMAESEPEIVLVLDWVDDAAPQRAIASAAGRDLIRGLDGLLTSAPEIAYYAVQD
jgi:hypothetical protein